MSTGKTLSIKSTSSAQTETLAAKFGSNLRGGEVLELVSDLGGGKTTFVRGLVRGAGSTDHVSSPTFKISNEYRAPKLTIYHFDFYRLQAAGVVADELAEVIGDSRAVVLIEWGEIVHDVLPAERTTLRIKNTTGESERELIFKYPESLEYLVEGLQ